jgi:acyl carrier protein
MVMAVRPPRVVGVCTLTTRELAAELCGAPGVAVAGPLMTANLGIEELVRSVLRDRTIGVLVVCGRDSALFQQGQSLVALVRNGVRPDGRIVGAAGHHPFLGLSPSDVDTFRSRIRLVDLREVLDAGRLRAEIATLARSCGATVSSYARPADRQFTVLRPVGRRKPIVTAGEGFFVISVDARAGEVVVRHYRDDFSAGHEMRGRRAESMVLGLLRAGLVGDPSHSAYLGAELAKAETALRLGLEYVQDIPLRLRKRLEVTMRSIEDFTGYLAGLLDVDTLTADVSIGDQVAVDSSRMIELAIALEQECGLDLDDDIDLRSATPAELFAGVPREAAS